MAGYRLGGTGPLKAAKAAQRCWVVSGLTAWRTPCQVRLQMGERSARPPGGFRAKDQRLTELTHFNQNLVNSNLNSREQRSKGILWNPGDPGPEFQNRPLEIIE